MKTYNYYQANLFLERTFQGAQLEAAKDYLLWSDEQAHEFLSDEEIERGYFPVWSEQELIDLGEND